MMEVTPQEKLALIVLATLIAAGTMARHAVFLGQAQERLAFTSEAADTLNGGGGALRERVSAELAREQARSQALGAGEKVDPNTASADELDRLPRVGPALALRIVEHRKANGRFATLEDLGDVSGIGPALLNTIAPHLTLRAGGRVAAAGGANRVDINRASAAELEQLPGVGPAIAERIVNYRTAEGRFRNFEDLEKVPGVGPSLRTRIETVARLSP
jgi:competence ComEA-like helix-hairpin-helix protein